MKEWMNFWSGQTSTWVQQGNNRCPNSFIKRVVAEGLKVSFPQQNQILDCWSTNVMHRENNLLQLGLGKKRAGNKQKTTTMQPSYSDKEMENFKNKKVTQS